MTMMMTMTMPMPRKILVLACLVSFTASFVPQTSFRHHHHVQSQTQSQTQTQTQARSVRALMMNMRKDAAADDDENTPDDVRRDLFFQAATFASSITMANLFPVRTSAAANSGIGSSPDAPIVVLGAGGKVGKLCCEILAQQGLYCTAVTRTGRKILDQDYDMVKYGAGDVTNYESVAAAVKGASGVIFAASASGKKKGGDPAHVDYLGVYNTAKACLAANVPKLAVISAGTVSRPDSAGYKATNFFVKYVYGDRIMDYKIGGEAIMRDMYAASGKPALAYTVVRPGGLSDKPSGGPAKLHLSQGDVYSSEVTREDVARVTVAALIKGKATDNSTFELNQVEGITKAMASLPDLPAELIHTGKPSFDALLDGLLTDAELKKKLPDVVSDFRGVGVEPIEKLV